MIDRRIFSFQQERVSQSFIVLYCIALYCIVSDTPPNTPPAGRGACEGQGWSPVGDHCFAVYATDRVSFAHAAFQCSWSGASLASIHHISTNNFLHEKVKAVSALPVWIGFRRSDNGWCVYSRLPRLHTVTTYSHSLSQFMMMMMMMITSTTMMMVKVVTEISSIVRAAYQSRNSSPKRVQNLATLGFCK